MNIDFYSRRLMLYFSFVAVMVAGMIGMGQMSWNLPLLVLLCTCCGFVFTDHLQWVLFPKWFVYIGMIVGAGVAIASFFSDPTSNQILAVGNLLVYVQLPLLFQKKSKRVFEQWGVFLLLELVVAALVNDNVLFGLLMVPVLTTGCAAMISLALYSSLLKHNESITESAGFFARIIHWLGKEQLVSRRSSGVTLSPAILSNWSVQERKHSFSPLKLFAGVLPFSFSVLVFAIVYFYCLPRGNFNAYEGTNSGTSRVGFSDQVSLRYVGDLLQNDTPVFRLSMRNPKTGENFRPRNPPYVRMTVSRRYFDGPSRGVWQAGDATFTLDRRAVQRLPTEADLVDEIVEERDSVMVDVVEKSSLGSFVPVIAPMGRSTLPDFRVAFRDWFVLDAASSARSSSRKRRFSYQTYAYKNGMESAFLPEWGDFLRAERITRFPGQVDFDQDAYSQLLEFPNSLNSILPLRDRVLEERGAASGDKLTKAIVLEDYLASGTDFQYTLSLTGQLDKGADPIADFLLNKRKGHCQYFATSLALLLRSIDVPSRVVIGFRPSEYNEIGQYFLVQQNHAHVWVEAYFSVDELKTKFAEIPKWIKHGAWLRLDPTPPGEGSNAGGTLRTSPGQTFDAMQDLWTELVMNMDKSKQSHMFSMFGESSSESYSKFWLEIQSALQKLQSNRFIGGFLSPEIWFSWRIFLILGSVVCMWFFVPRFFGILFPRWWANRQGNKSRTRDGLSNVPFYIRLTQLLKRKGVVRRSSQTPLEFLNDASERLKCDAFQLDAPLLTDLFYEFRYGSRRALSEDEKLRIEKQLKGLESLK